jgi:hypothetical protein
MSAAGNLTDEFATRKENSERRPKVAQGDGASEAASMAGYIAEMSAELALLAARAALPMLAHFLNLARVEAEIRSRELGGLDRPRRTARSRGAKRMKSGGSGQTE